MQKKLKPEIIKQIIEEYQAGATPIILSKKFGIRNNSVTRLLRKNGIERTQKINITQEQTNYIIQQYTLGISSEKIAKEMGINGSTVCRALKKNGIKIRPATENKRQYKIDQNYFQTIDTEEKAYLLGLLYADGNVDNSGAEIKITLQAIDRDILERFSHIIYGFTKLNEEKRNMEDGSIKTYLTFYIYCAKMHQDLCKLGCTIAKTFDIRFPQQLMPDELLRHFIRGYLDGDGCICTANINRPIIDITSNYEFIKELANYLINKLDITINTMQGKNPLTGSFQLGVADRVEKFLHFIYDDATIYMQRKYNKQVEVFKLNQEKIIRKTQKLAR